MSGSNVLSSPGALAQVEAVPPSATPAALAASAQLRQIHLPRRTAIAYIEQGPADGVPVVLLHGITDSSRSYDLLRPLLPAHLRVFALTMRGHGDSGRPGDYAMIDMAEDVVAFMEAMHIGPAVVVGHSMGTRVALRLAVEAPERVRRLVLIGAFAPGLPNPALDDLREAVAGMPESIPVAFAREFQEGCVARAVPPGYIDAMIAETLKVPAAVFRSALDGFMTDDPSSVLGQVEVPTLLLWGNRDAFVRRSDQDTLLDLLPHARLIAYEGTGHTPHWECPAAVAADLAAFLEDA